MNLTKISKVNIIIYEITKLKTKIEDFGLYIKFGIRLDKEEVGGVRRGSVAGKYTDDDRHSCGGRPMAVGHYWRRKAARQSGKEKGRVSGWGAMRGVLAFCCVKEKWG